MQQHLYMLIVMARKRHGYSRERKIRLGYILADSPTKAYTEGFSALAATHFPADSWSEPHCKVEPISFPRIESYRESLIKGRIVYLTFLFGYAAFHSKSGVLQGGTVIARSEAQAAQGISLRLEHSLAEYEAPSILMVPSRFTIRANISLEDPITQFRNKFPNIIKE